MNIVVLIKEVPDMDRVVFDHERGVINRASAGAEMNPLDRHALQAAVDLRADCAQNGADSSITALTMGPPTAARTLRDAYARGADRCVLLSDRQFGGADTLATARTLAAGIRMLGGFDLILCGEKTVDGDTAQVGAEVAELLGLPHTCCAEAVEALPNGVRVLVADMGGYLQVRALTFPALVSVTKNAARPGYATLQRKLASRSISVETYDLAGLSAYVTQEEVGLAGSPTRVQKIEVVPPAVRTGRVVDTYDDFYAALAERLQRGRG